MLDLETILVLVGTFLPIFGSGLTILLALITHGVTRWVILAVVPGVTLLVCWNIIDARCSDISCICHCTLYLLSSIDSYRSLSLLEEEKS
jgi:hypothetical protein